MIKKEEFVKLVQKAEDNGFRKCYIAKVKAHLMFKGNIYFNMTGIYKYEKAHFIKLDDINEENLNKYLEAK